MQQAIGILTKLSERASIKRTRVEEDLKMVIYILKREIELAKQIYKLQNKNNKVHFIPEKGDEK